jgi:hypothetical protein
VENNMCDRFIGITMLACVAFASLARADSGPVMIAEKIVDARQPQAAVSPAGDICITFGSKNTIYCVVSRDGGKNYGAPVKVGDAGQLALGMRRGPRIAATKEHLVITAIGGQHGGGKDGDVLAWRSADRGQTWHGPVRINSVAGAAREGLHHLAAGPDGGFYCVWNDLRVEHQMPVYGAASHDGGATWVDEKSVYSAPGGMICPCCQPFVTFDGKGRLHVMWRNHVGDSRDMYLTTFAPAHKLGEGTWSLGTCPMDGGAVAGHPDGRVLTVWRRDKEVFASEPGGRETMLGKGLQPWVAAGSGGFYRVWIAARPGALMCLTPDSRTPRQLADRASDPVIAAPANGLGPVVVVWEEGRPGSMKLRAQVLTGGAN